MRKEILFATSNPHKKERFQAYFAPLGLNVTSFADIENEIEVVEDGATPEENALKKAIAGYLATKRPTFGVDYWLRIEGLPEEIQPNQFVRRVFVENGERKDATDEEMLDYYAEKVKSLGGRTMCLWISAIALVIDPENTFVEKFSRETILTSEKSPKRTPGEPLNSIQIEPITGKYFTDLTMDDWLNLQKERERGYIKFMAKHLDKLGEVC